MLESKRYHRYFITMSYSAVSILIFSRFPSINLFDAITWFCAAAGVLCFSLFVLFFRDTMTVSYLKLKQNCNGFSLKPSEETVKKSGASTCLAIFISFK